MKKMMIGIGVLALAASLVYAGMDDVVITSTLKNTTAQTNEFVLRGKVMRIDFNPSTPSIAKTNTVSLVQGNETIFSKVVTNDISFTLGSILYDNTGVGATYTEITTGNTGTFNKVWVAGIPVAGKCTLIQTPNPTGTTNTWETTIIVEK